MREEDYKPRELSFAIISNLVTRMTGPPAHHILVIVAGDEPWCIQLWLWAAPSAIVSMTANKACSSFNPEIRVATSLTLCGIHIGAGIRVKIYHLSRRITRIESEVPATISQIWTGYRKLEARLSQVRTRWRAKARVFDALRQVHNNLTIRGHFPYRYPQ